MHAPTIVSAHQENGGLTIRRRVLQPFLVIMLQIGKNGLVFERGLVVPRKRDHVANARKVAHGFRFNDFDLARGRVVFVRHEIGVVLQIKQGNIGPHARHRKGRKQHVIQLELHIYGVIRVKPGRRGSPDARLLTQALSNVGPTRIWKHARQVSRALAAARVHKNALGFVVESRPKRAVVDFAQRQLHETDFDHGRRVLIHVGWILQAPFVFGAHVFHQLPHVCNEVRRRHGLILGIPVPHAAMDLPFIDIQFVMRHRNHIFVAEQGDKHAKQGLRCQCALRRHDQVAIIHGVDAEHGMRGKHFQIVILFL